MISARKASTHIMFPFLKVAVIDPGSLKKINELLEGETKGRGKVEVLNFASIEDDDEENLE